LVSNMSTYKEFVLFFLVGCTSVIVHYSILILLVETKDIHPVYDYFHDTRDKLNYVFYAEVKNPQEFDSLKEDTLSWVAFNETPKLLFTVHTKQDVIVGERVISAKWREDEARKLAS